LKWSLDGWRFGWDVWGRLEGFVVGLVDDVNLEVLYEEAGLFVEGFLDDGDDAGCVDGAGWDVW